MKKVKNIICVVDGKTEKAVKVIYDDNTEHSYKINEGQTFSEVLKNNIRKGNISLKGYNADKAIKVVQLHKVDTEPVKDTIKKEKLLQQIVVEAKEFEKDINKKAKGVANVKINVTAYDEDKSEENKTNSKKGKYVLVAIGGVVLGGVLALGVLKGCSNTPEVNAPSVTQPTDQDNDDAFGVMPTATPIPYDIATFDDINDQDKITYRAETIYGSILAAVEGTKYADQILDVYTVDTIDRMINYFNDGSIADFQAGDSLEYMNLIDGLTNLEGDLNTVLPLYMFQLDGTKGYEVAFQTYSARVLMMNGNEQGVQDLAQHLYEVFVMPGLNGSISVTSLENAGSKAFNLKYIMASNALAKETNEKATFSDFCGNELTWKELNKAVNEGRTLKDHDENLSVPVTTGEGSCVEITYLSSYCMGADQEMLIKNQSLAKILQP